MAIAPANGTLSEWVSVGTAIEWRSRVCPLPIAAEASETLRLWEFWQAKVLPLSGGLYDQPNLYLRAMALLEERFAVARQEAKT